MEITIYSIVIWVVGILIGSLGLVIYLGVNSRSSRAFILAIFWVMVWTIGMGFFISLRDLWWVILGMKLTYYIGSLIASSFIYFFLTYPNGEKVNKLFLIFLVVIQICLFYLYFFTDLMMYSPIFIQKSFFFPALWGWHFGPLSFLFELFFFGYFITGMIILYKKYIICDEKYTKNHIWFMLLTVIVGSTPASIIDIILPRFGYFRLDWLGPITGSLWMAVMAYSILKYQQLNVKAVLGEALVIGMTAIFFINIFTNIPLGVAGRIFMFLLFGVLGYYLIKAILREAQQKDQLRYFNEHLQEKVDEQTVEIRRAYEVEKNARQDLERLNDAKSQFIMITQHHLRTPVTTIQWELEALLGGMYGALTADLKKAVKNMQEVAGRLTNITDKFLQIAQNNIGNVSGSKPVAIAPVQQGIQSIIENVVAKFSSEILEHRIKVTWDDSSVWPFLNFDRKKIEEALTIIFDNAIKYNDSTDGIIRIKGITTDESFLLCIKNTCSGSLLNELAGLSNVSDKNLPADPAISKEPFIRSDAARELNPMGMGIGLMVAESIIQAHGGTIKIFAERPKMFVTTVSLPRV